MIYSLNDDFDIAVLEATLDKEARVADDMMQMVMLQHDINMAKAEHKVFCESGDSDDLELFYTEATEQTVEKQKGIIRRILDAIAKFIAGIGEKIANIFGKKSRDDVDAKAKVKAPNPDDVEKENNKLLAGLKSTVAKIKSGVSDSQDAIAGFGKALSVVVFAGGAVMDGIDLFDRFKKHREKRKSKDPLKEAEAIIDNAVKNEKNPEKIALFQKLAGHVKTWANKDGSVQSKILSAIPFKGKQNNAEVPEDSDNKNTQNKGEDSNKEDKNEDTNKENTENKEETKTESVSDDFESMLSAIYNAL